MSAAEASRFDERYRNPCTRGPDAFCVPYFYILGSFHGGVRDLYDRLLDAAPRTLFVPRSRRDGSYPYYMSETHMWERMLWRGCDYGACPRRRGAGAEPLHLETELPELRPGGKVGMDGAFGEVAGGALTFTWSSGHSVLHYAWDKNQSLCRAPHPRRRCFPLACEAQRQMELSIGAGEERQLTIPWLMRAVHGTSRIRLIGLLREPGDRMWSAYFFWPQYRRRYGKMGKEAEGFLKYVEHVIPTFRACLRAAAEGAFGHGTARSSAGHEGGATARWQLEQCAVNFESLSSDNEAVYCESANGSIETQTPQTAYMMHASIAIRAQLDRLHVLCYADHADQLLKSLYAAYIPSWLEAFGRDRLLLLRAEDYWKDPRAVLRRTLDFLGLSTSSSDDDLRAALAKPLRLIHGSNATFWGDKSIRNVHASVPPDSRLPGHTQSRIRQPMLPEARRMLSDFFGPYNAQLARLLGDERFTWSDVLASPATNA